MCFYVSISSFVHFFKFSQVRDHQKWECGKQSTMVNQFTAFFCSLTSSKSQNMLQWFDVKVINGFVCKVLFLRVVAKRTKIGCGIVERFMDNCTAKFCLSCPNWLNQPKLDCKYEVNWVLLVQLWINTREVSPWLLMILYGRKKTLKSYFHYLANFHTFFLDKEMKSHFWLCCFWFPLPILLVWF